MNNQVSEEIKIQKTMQLLKIAFGVIALGAVIGFGMHFLKQQKNRKLEKGFALLYQAEKLEEVAQREGVATSKTPLNVMLSWSPDKQSEYESKLKAVSDEFPATTPAILAQLKLGVFKFHAGKKDEAEQIFKGVIQSSRSRGDEVIYTAMAFDSLASTLESQQKLDEASKTYSEALAIQNNPLKPLAYLGAARVLGLQGKKDEAKAMYEKIVTEFPSTEYEKRAKALIALQSQNL